VRRLLWPAFIRATLACGAATVAGHVWIGGEETLKITGSPVTVRRGLTDHLDDLFGQVVAAGERAQVGDSPCLPKPNPYAHALLRGAVAPCLAAHRAARH